MKLALFQDPSPGPDLDAALTKAETALTAAAAMGAAALVLPEIWLQGYNQPDMPARALPLDSAPMHRLAKAAKAAQTALALGYAERAGDFTYNSAACFGPDGNLLANYRKIQLYGPRENALYSPGSAYATFRLGAEKAALLICYDIEFAPHIKALSDQGVTTILCPTANMMPFTHVGKHTVPTMSANHGLTIAYANYCGSEGDLTYVGGSTITGPHGEILAQAGKHPALLVAEIPAKNPAFLATQSADLREIK